MKPKFKMYMCHDNIIEDPTISYNTSYCIVCNELKEDCNEYQGEDIVCSECKNNYLKGFTDIMSHLYINEYKYNFYVEWFLNSINDKNSLIKIGEKIFSYLDLEEQEKEMIFYCEESGIEFLEFIEKRLK